MREPTALLTAPKEAGPDPGSPGRELFFDVGGAALLATLVAWTLISAAASGGDARPMIGLLLGSAAVYTCARLLGPWNRAVVPVAVVAVAAGVVLTRPLGELLRSGPLGGPLGYVNASAAFATQAAAAALMVAMLWRWAPGKVLFLAVGAALAVVPFVVGTHAGMIAAGGLLIAALLGGGRGARRIVVGSAAAVVVTVVASVFIATSYREGSRSLIARVVDATPLKEHRVELWREGLTLMTRHPLVGVGPGRFAEESPEARADVDSRHARNEYLQVGAETGVPGMVLLALLFLWGFARLWAVAAPDAATALGAVALAALAMHAAVDYVLHFPVVVIACAALVGAAARPKERRHAQPARA